MDIEEIKYKKMWEELEEWSSRNSVELYSENVPINMSSSLKDLMEEWKQKYFLEEEHPTPLEELKLQAKIFSDVLDGEINKGYPKIAFRRDDALLALFNELPVIIEDIYKKIGIANANK